MKCPNCSKVIKKSDNNCKYCGISIEKPNNKIVETKIIYKYTENRTNKWLVLAIGLLSFLIIIETSFNVWYFFLRKPIENIKDKIEKYNYVQQLPFEIHETNETFEFDNLLIKISDKHSILLLDNPYSIYNGKKVIKIPVTIKNNSDKDNSLNLFYYDIYDNNGNIIDEVAGYFDEALYYAEDLKKDEEYTKYIYALYYGSDSYSIKIGNNNKTIYIKYIINN